MSPISMLPLAADEKESRTCAQCREPGWRPSGGAPIACRGTGSATAVVDLRGRPQYHPRPYSPVAQQVEQVTVNHRVGGSSPSRGAKFMFVTNRHNAGFLLAVLPGVGLSPPWRWRRPIPGPPPLGALLRGRFRSGRNRRARPGEPKFCSLPTGALPVFYLPRCQGSGSHRRGGCGGPSLGRPLRARSCAAGFAPGETVEPVPGSQIYVRYQPAQCRFFIGRVARCRALTAVAVAAAHPWAAPFGRAFARPVSLRAKPSSPSRGATSTSNM